VCPETGLAFGRRAMGIGRPLAVLFAAVADERDSIASEPPIDIEARAASWTLEGFFVAVAGDQVVGSIDVEVGRHGFGEIGMAVAALWRGTWRWLNPDGNSDRLGAGKVCNKLSLSVFAHNTAAIALYRRLPGTRDGKDGGDLRLPLDRRCARPEVAISRQQ
jgi:hypothetical protein